LYSRDNRLKMTSNLAQMPKLGGRALLCAIGLMLVWAFVRSTEGWPPYTAQIIAGDLLLLLLPTALLVSLLLQRSRQRQTEGRNNALLRAVPDLMFLQTKSGVYLDYHASDPSWLLVAPEQFVGRNMRDVLPPALLGVIEPAFVRAASATEPVLVEYDMDLREGNRRFEARLVRCNDDQILTLVRDITERRHAEAALRESSTRYRLAATAGAVGVWDWDFAGNELYVDPGLKALLGFEDAEISNRPDDWGSRVHPDDLALASARVKACLDGETDVYEVEHRMLHKDGSARWFLSRGSAIRGADGALQRLVGTKVDITERKRSADQFRLALEATTTGMLMVSREGQIVLVNAHVERLFGYRREDLIDAPVDMLLPQWSSTACEQRELDGLRKDGTTIPLEIGFSPLQTPEGKFVLCSINDVTERRSSEGEREELTTHLRDMAGRLIAAQEVERARLARDLHDDISQQIAALSISLSGLKRHVAKAPGGTDFEAEIVLLQNRAETLAESVRRLSHDLHPDVLRHAGLAASLRAYCSGLVSPSHELSVTCDARGNFDTLEQDAAICLYRIAQEALHNVVKHAEARHAEVLLVWTPEGAELTVSDDGKGFDIQVRRNGVGLGLVSITERARLAGGTLSIVTSANKGTKVRVLVPIAIPSAAEASATPARFAGLA